jgi:hypothetical protein
MSTPIIQVDAFADRPFSGNPAAVCFLAEQKSDQWMQAVAAEMNLSETALLLEQDGGYRLRWFTPKIEVDLCGHATLASAHVLWSEGRVPLDREIHFHTNSGLLKARRRGDLIELDFPTEPESEVEPPPGLVKALGVSAKYVGKNRFDDLVELDSEEDLRAMMPDFAQLGRITWTAAMPNWNGATSGGTSTLTGSAQSLPRLRYCHGCSRLGVLSVRPVAVILRAIIQSYVQPGHSAPRGAEPHWPISRAPSHCLANCSPERVPLSLRGLADERCEMPVGGRSGERAGYDHDGIRAEVWKHGDAFIGRRHKMFDKCFGIRMSSQTRVVQQDELERPIYRGGRDWWCFPAEGGVWDVRQLGVEQ